MFDLEKILITEHKQHDGKPGRASAFRSDIAARTATDNRQIEHKKEWL